MVLAWALVLALPSAAGAQLQPGGFGDSKGPIAISADHLEADDPDGLVTFSGSVVARQGEMTITCDLMKIYYVAKPVAEGAAAPAAESKETGRTPLSGAGRQIDRVECEGDVKVVEGDRMAVGRKALYLAQSLPRRIILTGEARVWQGRDSLTGHQVTYLLDEKRSLVEGGEGGRVRTVYHQEERKP